MRLDIDPGAEWLLPFAKKKLADLKAHAKRLGLNVAQKILNVDGGQQIALATRHGIDSISIRGGAPFGWFTRLIEGVPRQRAGVIGTNLAPLRFEGGDVGDTSSPFAPMAGWSATHADYRNNTEIVGGTVHATSSLAWVGFLSSYEHGGQFQFPALASSTLLAALSDDGRTVVARATTPGGDFRFYRSDLAPETLLDGALNLHATTTDIGGFIAGYTATYSFSIDRGMYAVCWSDSNTVGSTYSVRALALRIATGVRSEYVLDTLVQNLVTGYLDTHTEIAASVVSTPATTTFADGVDRPWAFLSRNRIVTLTSGDMGQTVEFVPMWQWYSLYRGGFEVVRFGAAFDGFKHELHTESAAVSTQGAGLIAFWDTRTTLLQYDTLVGVPVYREVVGSNTNQRTLVVVEGTTVVYQALNPVTLFTLMVDSGGTVVLAQNDSSPSGAMVIEKLGTSWVASNVAVDPLDPMALFPFGGFIQSMLPTAAQMFEYVYREGPVGAQRWFRGKVAKVSGQWVATRRAMGAAPAPGVSFVRAFDTPQVLAL